MLRHPLARALEARAGGNGAERVDDAVVEADHGQVGLRDREVLVVPRVGDDRLPLRRNGGARAARQVEAVLRGQPVAGGGLAHLQVEPVGLVELLRSGISRARAVEGVEVEARRAGLEERGRSDVLPEHHVRLVEGQVVVDELAEVREARRDPDRAPSRDGHRLREGLSRPLGDLLAATLRAHAGEAEGRGRRLGGSGERRLTAAEALAEQALAEDVVALGSVFHGPLLSRENAHEKSGRTAA